MQDNEKQEVFYGIIARKRRIGNNIGWSNYAPNPNDNPLKVPSPTEIPNIADIICW